MDTYSVKEIADMLNTNPENLPALRKSEMR